jgi:hypothetical protein
MTTSLSEREKEISARHLLSHQHLIAQCLKARDWKSIQALAEYMKDDAPQSLVGTDPALYRTLRSQITEARLRWSFNLSKINQLLETI